MTRVVLFLLLTCAALPAEEAGQPDLRQAIMKAVDTGEPLEFGAGVVRRSITFISWEAANREMPVIEPMSVLVSDEVRVGASRRLISIRQLRKDAEFYRQAVAAVGENPVFQLVLWEGADSRLIQRAIIAITPNGESQLVALFPSKGDDAIRLGPPISKKPSPPDQAKPICLVHNCPHCGRGKPTEPLIEMDVTESWPADEAAARDPGPEVDYSSRP